MPTATIHGIGVITKLYLVVFVAFKESVTLNLAQIIQGRTCWRQLKAHVQLCIGG